ncbi:MAG TPA: hypothetical protein PKA95_08885 [Thermomicrobiales bacterium]|nr:hypothetical protein [Thermomicrobiales bacterium]
MSTPVAERWGIIGHDEQVEALAGALAAGRVSHAYLITGPAGVGKTTLALTLARSLNCTAPAGDRPCGVCEDCRRTLRGSHPDVTLVNLAWQDVAVPAKNRSDRSGSRQELSINAVRHLRQDIVTRPVLGRYKLQIVDDASLLSDSAVDAYLKTLEEPPPFAVIVLVAESAEQVSETIRSRCRIVELGSVPRASTAAALRERGVEPVTAERIARAAHGRAGWALDVAATPAALTAYREQVETAWEHGATPLGRVALSGTVARDFTKRRAQTFALLDSITGIWRDALLYRAGLPGEAAFPDLGDRLAPWAAGHELRDLHRALDASRQCLIDLSNNVQARIALHAMVMQWPD